MPVFDRSASRFDRVEADFLRGVLGTGKHEATPFQHASREYRRRQQRAAAARALIVIVLLGVILRLGSDDERDTAPSIGGRADGA